MALVFFSISLLLIQCSHRHITRISFYLKEREHEVGWVGGWERTWEELGKRKEYDQNASYEVLKKTDQTTFFLKKKKVLYPQLKIINNKEIKIADEAVKGILIIPQISECSMIL